MDKNLNDQSDPFASKKALLSMHIESRALSSSISNSNSYSISSTDDNFYIETNKNCKCSLHDHNRIKFYNRPRSQPNRCICTSERFYNCNYCTSNYPISVRRSKDGEETDYSSKLKQTFENRIESSNDLAKINLKPSPLPVSSHLIALLSLTAPSNKFIPPPNKNLAALNQTKDRDTELVVCE